MHHGNSIPGELEKANELALRMFGHGHDAIAPMHEHSLSRSSGGSGDVKRYVFGVDQRSSQSG